MRKGATRYRAGREIARGGWGMVFEARDLETGRTVAIKVILPALAGDATAVARLVREGRVMMQLGHPNICAVVDRGRTDDGRPFIVMEHLAGKTLRDRLKHRDRRLDVETAIEIAVQLFSALDAVHAEGIIHRDVKPANIMLTPAGGRAASAGTSFVKLLDFGVCCRRDRREEQRTLTESWCVIGTPAYMAPEVAFGDRMFDERADLYSAALILHQMLTGRRFFPPRCSLHQIATRPSPPLLRALDPNLPYALERVVARALEHDPILRYRSAKELLHELLEARTAFRRREARIRNVVRGSDDEALTRILNLEALLA